MNTRGRNKRKNDSSSAPTETPQQSPLTKVARKTNDASAEDEEEAKMFLEKIRETVIGQKMVR